MVFAVTTDPNPPTDDSAYSADIPKETQAGTYYVWYKVKGDDNHSDTEPQSLTVTENDISFYTSEGDKQTCKKADIIISFIAYMAHTDELFRAKLAAVQAGISAFLSGRAGAAGDGFDDDPPLTTTASTTTSTSDTPAANAARSIA